MSNNKMIRMKRIEGRLSKEGLNDETRAKLEARLARHKQTSARPNAPGLMTRLARLDAKLAEATDPLCLAELAIRRARVEQRLSRTAAPAKNAGTGKYPGLTRRLAEIERKLEATDAQRARLEQRKARLEAQLAGKAHKDKVAAEEGEEGKPTVVEESREAATPFPRLTDRLVRVETKLATATDPALRGVLQDRAERLRRQLARKMQQQQRQAGGGKDKRHCPHLAHRLDRVLARLETVEDEGKRVQLEERKSFLEMKIQRKSRRKNRKNCLAENLTDRTQELYGAAGPEKAEDMLQRGGIMPENRNKDRNNQDAAVFVAPLVTAGMHPRRAKQQQRLLNMESKARDNGRPKALARIALQQVYVAHYPDDVDYVPLFDRGEDLVVRRAALRQRALEAAAGRAGAEGVAAWMAADMYARLPAKWSLDDEIATFGGGGEREKSDESAAARTGAARGAAEAGLGDSFVQLQLQPTTPPPEATTVADSWVQVDPEEESEGGADAE